MKTQALELRRPRAYWNLPLLLLTALLLAAGSLLGAVTITVVDEAGAPVNDYRWQLQEDIANPGIPYVQTNNTVSIVSHRNDARILGFGHATSSTWPIRVPKYTWPDIVPPGTVVATATNYLTLTNNTPYNNDTYAADPSPTNK